MKNIVQGLLICFAISSTGYGQDENRKDFLRNYKAPDFRMQRLDLGFTAFGNGGDDSNHSNSLDFDAFYSQYSNQSRYQGYFNSFISTDMRLAKVDSINTFRNNTTIMANTENYFYINREWFLGASGMIAVSTVSTNKKYQQKGSSLHIVGMPQITIGNGRMEPVHYARNAWDIEKSLVKGGRLNGAYTNSQLTQLADCIAEINNVRYFDYRLRRIEQFNEIDEKLKKIGGVSEFDMTYFTYLSDAYLYAKNFERFSGIRHQMGIAQGAQYVFTSNDSIQPKYYFQTYGFYQFNLELPTSYTFQHSVKATIIAGARSEGHHGEYSDVPTYLSAAYTLGLYPTTRTHFYFGTKGGIYIDNYGNGESISAVAGGDVYFSPRFRLNFDASAIYGRSYDPLMFNSYLVNVPLQNNSGLDYQFEIKLSYALF